MIDGDHEHRERSCGMPFRHDQHLQARGTRFKLYAQPRCLDGFAEPVRVWVSSPLGSLGPGPSDRRMAVVDAVDKRPYDPETELPPWRGMRNPPVAAGPDGHFDHLEPSSREFGCAHMFGAVRRVLDIWEGYLGSPIAWHFSDFRSRLEMIPYVSWDNAQAGYGYLETGTGKPKHANGEPFCLNFDVLAHEAGHLIVFSLLGIPDDETLTTEYRAFHESASDLVALLSVLHFPSVVDHVLAGTCGNLYLENELSRLAELAPGEQIRLASNAYRMSDVPDTRVPWDRLTQKQVHQVGEPMTGAMFDTLVEIFQQILVESGVIQRDLERLADRAADGSIDAEPVRAAFAAAYAANPEGFRTALIRARDIMGFRLARTWQETSPHQLRLAEVAARFLSIDRRRSGERFQGIIRGCLTWRQIGWGFRQDAG
jgi:hypothetical protein